MNDQEYPLNINVACGPVLRDSSAITSDVSSYDCYSDNFERWLDSETARRIANDNGNRTSFDDVMKELGLSYSDLESVEVEADW